MIKNLNEKIFNILFSFANKSAFTKKTVVFLIKATYYLFFLIYTLGGVYLLINFKIYGYIQLLKYIFIPFFAFLTARIIRNNISAKRPFEKMNIKSLIYHKGGNSFPSNHSVSAMVLAMVLSQIFLEFTFIFIILAIITGILRIMAGLHYPIDVLFGLFIGFCFGYISFLI